MPFIAEPAAVVMGRGRTRSEASEMSFDAQPVEPPLPTMLPDAAGARPALDFTSHRYHPLPTLRMLEDVTPDDDPVVPFDMSKIA